MNHDAKARVTPGQRFEYNKTKYIVIDVGNDRIWFKEESHPVLTYGVSNMTLEDMKVKWL